MAAMASVAWCSDCGDSGATGTLLCGPIEFTATAYSVTTAHASRPP